MKYIERNGYLERVWQIEYETNWFRFFILVRGTEPEMRNYMEAEMGYVGRYHAMTDHELDCADALGIKVYLAPKDPDR